MSKAILVLDKMPENCAQCPMYTELSLGIGFCDGSQKTIKVDKLDKMCPLRELPEHMAPLNEEDVKGIKETFTNYHAGHVVGWNEGFRDGWNYCLKKILGKEGQK